MIGWQVWQRKTEASALEREWEQRAKAWTDTNDPDLIWQLEITSRIDGAQCHGIGFGQTRDEAYAEAVAQLPPRLGFETISVVGAVQVTDPFEALAVQ